MFKKNYKSIAYILILILPLFLLFSQSKLFSSFKFSIIEITSVPMQIISFPIREIRKMLYYHWTFEEYKRLSKENSVLKTRLAGLEQTINENARLERLLEVKRNLIYSSVAANIIGRDPSYWNSSIIIDKGSAEGVRQGFPVVNAWGVVGKIVEVGPHKSKVILLTDPEFSVAATIERSRESGLVSGTLQGLCRMRYLSVDADVRLGDKVITSKLSSAFPENMMVGEIIKINQTVNQSSLECLIRPTVPISQLEEVLVILKQ